MWSRRRDVSQQRVCIYCDARTHGSCCWCCCWCYTAWAIENRPPSSWGTITTRRRHQPRLNKNSVLPYQRLSQRNTCTICLTAVCIPLSARVRALRGPCTTSEPFYVTPKKSAVRKCNSKYLPRSFFVSPMPETRVSTVGIEKHPSNQPSRILRARITPHSR